MPGLRSTARARRRSSAAGRAAPRRLAGILLALVAAALLLPGAARASTPVPPLSTRGARIVDAEGRTAILQGVNWFGFETSAHVVHGLWTRDYRDVLAQIRAAGFNTIRLPFSLAALESATTTGIDFSGGKNGPLRGRTPLQALDAIIDAAAREHLLVLLDNHSATDDGYQQPLWYGDGGYTEDDWIGAWRRLATRYADRPNVIGADLKNEPHGPATWGAGGPTDWRRAAERAGRAIAAIAPHWLLVVEGVEGRVAGQRLGGHWWGGNVEGVRRAPVRLPNLVYSPHEYGPGVFPQPWFTGPHVAEVLEQRWETGFGFLVERQIAPVLVGEWGGREVGLDTVEGRWQRQFMDYLARTGISWTYWALNPDSGDTGGVLRDDWTSLEPDKARLLRQLIARERIAFASRVGAGREEAGATASGEELGATAGAQAGGTTAGGTEGGTAAGAPEAGTIAGGHEAVTPAGATTAGAPRASTIAGGQEALTPAGATTAGTTNGTRASRPPGGAAPWLRHRMRTIEPLLASRTPAGVASLPAPPGAGSPSVVPGPAAPPAGPRRLPAGEPRFLVDARWDAGWCGHIEVGARADVALAGRSVVVGLPAGTRLTQSWNGEPRSPGGEVVLRLPDWARAAPNMPYAATGLCVAGSRGDVRVTLR